MIFKETVLYQVIQQRIYHWKSKTADVGLVFLRVLEYYEGIMFLTTNRIDCFDEAFKSRIHLAIKYPTLSHSSRRDLWRAFIFRASPGSKSSLGWLNMGSLGRLADEELNGRQIKNIVRTAHALAVSEGSDMRLDHINMSLRAMKEFEADIAENKAKHGLEEDPSVPLGRMSKRHRMG